MPADEERRRVVPVIAGLRAAGCEARISVDTTKAEVAAAALDAGAEIVNDVTALRGDPEMAPLVAERGAGALPDAHARRPADDAARPPLRATSSAEVRDFLAERTEAAVAAGVARERIVIDPGIGFGKTIAHNLALLAGTAELAAIGPPVLVGTSRKSFLGRITGRDVHDRLAATIATNVIAFERGARIFRVHDVAAVRDALTVAAATVTAPWPPGEPDDFDEVDDEDSERAGPEVAIEVSGLSLYTQLGVTAAEREVGQRLLIDLRLEVGECDATVTDRLEDTVDYAAVCEAVVLVTQQRTYKTLERLCAAIADRLLERLRRALGVGQGGQARAADGAAAGRGVGRAVA